ncbi:MAG: hypothetical protein ABI169_10755, partial [Chitinophagaceae bacterium]
TIENFDLMGTTYMYNYFGYFCTGKITNNRFNNLAHGGSGYFYWYMGYYGEPKISHNSFTNISQYGTGGFYTYGPAYYSTGAEFDHNLWDSIYVKQGPFQPTYTYPQGGNVSLHDNVMTNMYIGSTSAAVNFYYLYTSYNATFDFYNNTLSDVHFPTGYNSTNSIGVNMSVSMPFNVYNNTIRIKPNNASLLGTNFGFTGMAYTAGSTIDYRNNIVNIDVSPGSGGYITALRRTSGTSGTAPTNFLGSSNGNIYYSPNVANSWLYGEGSSAAGMVNTYNLTNDPTFNTPCGLFKSFMGHDKSSFTENNLVASPYPGAYWPTGASYAKKGSVPTTAPQVVYDLANVTRPALYDMGVLQFTGTATDDAPPVISYAPIPTRSYCVTTPTLVATITDVTGVDTSLNKKPRLYYKKSTDANAFTAANNNTGNGWKYVEPASITGSSYTFNFDYNKLRSAVVAGDSITYFVIAQDITTNANTSATTAAFTLCPGTVALASGNFPVLNSPTPSGFKILNTPTFLATAYPGAVCLSGSAVVTVNPSPVGATMQWESAPLGGSFTPITGATGLSINTGILTASKLYRVVIYCGSSVLAISPIDTFVVANPSLLGVINDTLCGYGNATLSVIPAPFVKANWYKAATGGTAFFSGNTYTTPKISSTTTYYVAANTPNASTEVAGKTPPASYSYTMYNYGHEIVFHNASTNFYSTTVYPTGSGTVTLELVDIASGNPAKDIFGNFIPQRTFSVSGTSGVASPNVLNLNWANIAPGDYSFNVATGMYSNNLYFNYEYKSPTWPYPYNTPSGGVSIVGPTYNSAPYPYPYYYWFFYYNTFSGDCEAGARVPVKAVVTPAPPITVSNPSYPGICVGKSATICVSSANTYYAYAWNPGATTTPCITVSPSGPTTYYVTAIDPYTGCTQFDSAVVNVNAVPAAPIITPTNPTICSGSSVLLNGSSPPGLAGNTIIGTGTAVNSITSYPTPYGQFYGGNHDQYIIRGPELLAAGIKPNTLITSLAFYVTTTYTGGAMPSFWIQLGNTTNATASPATLICAPTLQTVYGPSTVNITGTGWQTYYFTSNFLYTGGNLAVDVSTLNCSNCTIVGCATNYTYNGIVSQSATTYVSAVSFYADYNCTVQTCTPTTGNQQFSQRPNMRFDYKQPTALNWLNVTGLWKNSNLTTAIKLTDTITNVYSSPATTTVYTAVSNANGCISLPSLPDTVFVNPSPDVTLTPAGANTICNGSSVTLCVPTAANQTYQWYLNGGAIPTSSGGTSNCYTATAAGTYKVTVINIITGCSSTSINSVVTVKPAPTVSVSSSSSTTFCNGGSTTLTATATRAALYQWAKNGTNIAGATGKTYVATTT